MAICLFQVVRDFSPIPVEIRTPLLNGYERGQVLTKVQRRIVYLDLADAAAVTEAIKTYFPGSAGGDGAFFLDGDPQYADIVDKSYALQNVVLTGSRRMPEMT
jgi:hypothetical protein